MSELCAKSKTFSLELYILFSEYRKWRVWILAGTPTFLTEDSLDFPQYFQAQAGTILKLGPKPLLFTSFTIYYVCFCLVTIIGSILQYVWTIKYKLILEDPFQCDSLIYLLNLQITENYTKDIWEVFQAGIH